jgi:hypothetical protein
MAPKVRSARRRGTVVRVSDRERQGFEFNILQTRRQGNSIASARPVALRQSRDARSGARACWHAGSVNCRNTG